MMMMKHLLLTAMVAAFALDASAALADAKQTHHCKLTDGSVDAKKTHKECDAVKGEWATDAATPPAKADAKPSAPSSPAAPTLSKNVANPAPAKPATTTAGDNTQVHHCRMPDKTTDLKKTHKECEAAKGQWAKDVDAASTTTPPAESTQDHHCRMPDKTTDTKKTHKECEAAKGEWAKDADSK